MFARATVASSTTGSSQLNAPSSSEGIGSTLSDADGAGGGEKLGACDGSAVDADGLVDGLTEGLAVWPMHPASTTPTMTSGVAR
jgi:hypothetical protein